MSPWTVELTPEGEDTLADIWLEADDRQTVTEAETAIYGLLQSDPVGRGVPVAEGLFKIARAPLVAFYSIDHAERIVRVSWFWRPK
jgi:hypothetical protein